MTKKPYPSKKATKSRKAKAKKNSPKWKLTERVIHLLEKAISPGSRVLQDIELKDINTGTPRQFDVVVYSAKPPRDTLSVVEVQDRGRNVTLPMFEGWCRKRESVGAQHLICVSVAGFSDAVKVDAKRQGLAVRLLTLAEPTNLPPFLRGIPTLSFEMHVVEKRDITPVMPENAPDDFERLPRLPINTKNLEVNGKLTSGFEVCDEYFTSGRVMHSQTAAIDATHYVRNYVVPFQKLNHPTFEIHGDVRVPIIELRVLDTVEHVSAALNPKLLAYEQVEFSGGVLAWALTGVATYENNEVPVNVVFIQNSDGKISVATVSHAIPGHTRISSTINIIFSSEPQG
jgi:hypothetical protein